MLALIALRNLSRNGRRTLLSLLVISVGTAGLLLTAGFIRYSFDGLRDAVIQGGLGQLEVAPASAAGEPASLLDQAGRPPKLSAWREIQSAIESRPYVRAAGATIQFAGMASHADNSA